MSKTSFSLAIKNADGTLRSPAGRYTAEDRWLDAETAHWYAASEQRILRHIGRLKAGAEVVVVSHQETHEGALWGLPESLRWASGDHGFFVGKVRGCRVVAVRRFVGYVAPHLARVHLSGITAYWTSVIETAPGSEKPRAYNSARYYTDDYTPYDEATQRRKCANQTLLLMSVDNIPIGETDG
jgi:hypothetical protein